jgi:nitroimidazol reductase NimA-like FMN-containing flavoprotein (pyridoxamine 5'-phosphate oxidase superfamily)
MASNESGTVETLGPRDSWALLGSAKVGRLAVVVAGRPEIFPVNHVVDHGTVVFRTAPGTKLAAIRGATPVAFEADGLDLDTGVAWSVILKGHAVRVTGRNLVLEAAALPIFPWHDEPKNWFVRVEADEISGRRFVAAQASRPAAPDTPDQDAWPG